MLIMSQSLYAAVLDHVLAIYPLEACGLLGGQNGRALIHYPVDNILRSPIAYEMEPLQQIRAMLDIEARGMELLAIYHSHPQGAARPSLTDIAQAHYPEAVQIIISLQTPEQPETRAFHIVDGKVTEVPYEIVQL